MLLDRIANPPAGLLRRGSPVTNEEGTARGVVFGLPGYDVGRPNLWGINWLFVIHTTAQAPILDLTDATGRAHLAAWLCQQKLAVNKCTRDDGGIAQRLIDMALWFEPMTPTEIDLLARLALRVMGREA